MENDSEIIIYTGAGCNDRDISGRPANHRSVLASTDQENNLSAGEERQLYLRQGDPFRHGWRLEEDDWYRSGWRREEDDRYKTEEEAIDCKTKVTKPVPTNIALLKVYDVLTILYFELSLL